MPEKKATETNIVDNRDEETILYGALLQTQLQITQVQMEKAKSKAEIESAWWVCNSIVKGIINAKIM